MFSLVIAIGLFGLAINAMWEIASTQYQQLKPVFAKVNNQNRYRK